MKKLLILLQILIISTFTSITFASEVDEYAPDLDFCGTLTTEIIKRSDIDLIKSCKCYEDILLRGSLPVLFGASSELFDAVCEDVNTRHNCIYENEGDSVVTAKKIKLIDENNNCRIDTNTERCKVKLLNLMLTLEPEVKIAKQQELFGCYGDSAEPKSLLDFQGEDANLNTFQTFDEEKGFIASKAQKETLKRLANNEAGPVIGFVNMIINYLIGIIFVLCMASLIYGGYNLIFAGFDSDMTEKGKNAIKYAITGFFLAMLSYTIVILIQSLF
jgi:hypothetical protein